MHDKTEDTRDPLWLAVLGFLTILGLGMAIVTTTLLMWISRQ